MARKICFTTLSKLIAEGVPRIEIARHFGVSPAAITKACRRLETVPDSVKGLTLKQRKFAELRAQGANQTQAAAAAYNVSSREAAKVIGSQLSKDQKVGAAISDLLEAAGVGRTRRCEKLAELVEHPDPSISLRALDLSFKIDGTTKTNSEQPAQTIVLADLSCFRRRRSEDTKIVDITSY